MDINSQSRIVLGQEYTVVLGGNFRDRQVLVVSLDAQWENDGKTYRRYNCTVVPSGHPIKVLDVYLQ